MTPTEEKLLDALIACRDRFVFYVGHHREKGDADKAAENYKFVTLANKAITAARQSEPPNFCARCGKRLKPESVHTCTPPMSRDAELEQARAEERSSWPDLTCVIQWLEAGCDPKDAAKELRLYQAAIRARGQK